MFINRKISIGGSYMNKKHDVPPVKKANLHYHHYNKRWNKEMRLEFKKVGDELVRAGLLAELDIPLLERLIELRFQMEKVNGFIQECDNIKDMQTLLTMNNNLQNQSLKLEIQLGMTSKSRPQISPLVERYDFDNSDTTIDSEEWGE